MKPRLIHQGVRETAVRTHPISCMYIECYRVGSMGSSLSWGKPESRVGLSHKWASSFTLGWLVLFAPRIDSVAECGHGSSMALPKVGQSVGSPHRPRQSGEYQPVVLSTDVAVKEGCSWCHRGPVSFAGLPSMFHELLESSCIYHNFWKKRASARWLLA